MPGRSFFVDSMIQNAEDIKILSFHTGQDPYINLWNDKKENETKFKLDTVKNIPLLVPGNNDKDIYKGEIGSFIFTKNEITHNLDIYQILNGQFSKVK